jgi:hypothetical protein
MNGTSDALMTLDEYKQSLLTSIHIGITATNHDDEYSVGLRNGLRICKAYIDGQEPEYEEVKNDPLTWDELKSMEGKPVWVEGVEIVIGGSIPVQDWYLIEWISDDDFEAVLCDRHGNQMIYPRNGDWQAYRKERG